MQAAIAELAVVQRRFLRAFASEAADAGDGAVELTVTGSPILTVGAGQVEVGVRLTEPRRLRLRVTDFDGRLVRTLFEGSREPGRLVRRWQGDDETGEPVPKGPYRIELTAAMTGGDTSGRERLEAWSEFYRRNCRERLIDYVRLDTRTPFDRALLAYLEKRARLL